ETGGEDLSDFAGLRDRSPVLAGSLAVFVLSLAGLPPLAGFFGKFYLFSVALRSTDNYVLLWLVAISLFGRLMSLYFCLLFLARACVDGSNTSGFAFRGDLLTRLAIVILALAVLLLGIFPASLLDRILASF